ncbi:MAG: Vitamin K epoxide reductase family protein [Armatimonadetes bacterium OLB18]|nr:MAG: Vitamin K epoxide reductase family protein [Armatimonadetes bacterium OLB18]
MFTGRHIKGSRASIVANHAILVLSSAGVAVTGILSIAPLLGRPIPCSLGGSCGVVTSSEFGFVLGLPIAVLGLLMYLAVTLLTLLRLIVAGPDPRKCVPLFNLSYFLCFIGGLVSLGLTYVSIMVLEAICLLCVLSNVLVVALLAGHAFVRLGQSLSMPSTPRVAIVPLMMIAAGVFGGLSYTEPPAVPDAGNEQMALRMQIDDLAPPDSIRFGPESSSTRVILFLDVHCGPCTQAFGYLEKASKRGKGFLLIVRRFPLKRDGPGWRSAVLLESLRDQGEFRKVFRSVLSASPRSPRDVEGIVDSILPSTPGRRSNQVPIAESRVERDWACARELELAGTPSIVLIEDDGRRRIVGLPGLIEALNLSP